MSFRSSAPATAREEIISRIQAGVLSPGDRLDEATLSVELGVSRNTLRENFRLLATDGYVEHLPHRGVFVRTVDVAAGRRIYAARRFLECGTLAEVAASPHLLNDEALTSAREAVARGMAAGDDARWQDVGTANTEFHLALGGLAGNEYVVRMLSGLMVEMRLLFLGLGDPAVVHGRYIDENVRVLRLLEEGHYARAGVALETYLLRAQDHLTGDGLAGRAR